jgi:hypothetical protein
MKLPPAPSNLTILQRLEEFEVWLTPYSGEIRLTTKFADALAASVRAFEWLCEATNNFADEAALTHEFLRDEVMRQINGRSAPDAKQILLDLVGVLFMATGKAGNSAKVQLPVFLKNVLKRTTLPRTFGRKNRRIEQAAFSAEIDMPMYMGWVANLDHSPSDQRSLLDIFLRFVLNERIYLTQLWSLGHSYASLWQSGRGESLLSPFVVFQVRGSVAASSGHEPERNLRELLGQWGLQAGVDFNTNDVILKDDTIEELGRELNDEEKVKTRAYDIVLPYKTPGWRPRVLIQCQFYAGDSGSVAHKTVDQVTASRRETSGLLRDGVLFVEYLDGAGVLGSLSSDLRSIMAMANTAFVLQMRTIPVRIRRAMQEIGYLTPLEVEHAILSAGPDRLSVIAALVGDGYDRREVERVIAFGQANNLFDRPNGEHIAVRADRKDQARAYFVLDIVALSGRAVDVATSSLPGFISIPGYGPYFGLEDSAAKATAVDVVPGFAADWPDDATFQADVMQLAQRNFVMYTPPL